MVDQLKRLETDHKCVIYQQYPSSVIDTQCYEELLHLQFICKWLMNMYGMCVQLLVFSSFHEALWRIYRSELIWIYVNLSLFYFVRTKLNRKHTITGMGLFLGSYCWVKLNCELNALCLVWMQLAVISRAFDKHAVGMNTVLEKLHKWDICK